MAEDIDELYLTDIVSVSILQKIQDAFSELTGMAALTTDAEGRPVTKGSNFTDHCMNVIRKNEEGRKQCEQCDKMGAKNCLDTGNFTTYYCHSNLVDFAAPIMVEGKMIGSFIGGQVLPKAPKKEDIYAIAKRYGIDEAALWDAAQAVPVVSKDKIETSAEALYTLSGIISSLAYGKYLAIKSAKEMEDATRMKSDFLANMSHEIRTPMNAVIGLSEMTLREELPPAAQEYVSQIKSSAVALLAIINDILDFSKIESGKMDIIEEEYEPLSIVNDVSNVVSIKMKDKSVELMLDIDPSFPCLLEGDNQRIKQVLINLVNNAIKFTREGHVIVHLTYEKVDETRILARVDVEDTGIGIKKKDQEKVFESFNQADSKRNRNIEGTGLGLAISKKLVELMNGKMWLESEYEKGSTFSFEIPQRVMDWSPSIIVQDRENKYVLYRFSKPDIALQFREVTARIGVACEEVTDFREAADKARKISLKESKKIFLFTDEVDENVVLQEFLKKNSFIECVQLEDFFAEAKKYPPKVRVIKKPLSPIRIALVLNGEKDLITGRDMGPYETQFIAPEAEVLLVDDNVVNLKVAKGLLEPLKMRITAVTSGKEALEEVDKKYFDLIFMDHMMPELDGVETTRIIRRLHPDLSHIPIIALTANAMEGTKRKFLEEGMNDFVSKPIDVKILCGKVRQWLPPEKVVDIDEDDATDGLSREESHFYEQFFARAHGDLNTHTARLLLGNDKLLYTVMKEFYTSITKKSAEIEAFLQAKDWPGYTIVVHALKSEAKQIGAMELAGMAAELEMGGNSRDTEFIEANTEALLQKYRSYIEVLAEDFAEEKKDDTHKEIMSEGVLMQTLAKLKTAIEDLDMDLFDEVGETLSRYAYSSEAETAWAKDLKEACTNMDTESCEELMAAHEAFSKK